MKYILLPKRKTSPESPLVFLAGPIRGAPAWHDEAIPYIHALAPELTIASPSRDLAPSLQPYVRDDSTESFERQRAWEMHYIDLAQRTGAQLFWLPGETSHKCEKSYGAMTRVELGEALIEYHHDPSRRIVIGSDGTFSELRSILVDIEHYAPALLPLKTTLADTCRAAIDLARNKI